MIASCNRHLPPTPTGLVCPRAPSPHHILLPAVEDCIAKTSDRFAKTYDCLIASWDAFAGDFESNRKRRRLAVELVVVGTSLVDARRYMLNEIDDIGGHMWWNVHGSIKNLKVHRTSSQLNAHGLTSSPLAGNTLQSCLRATER